MATVKPYFLSGKAGAAIATAFTFVKQDADGDIINCSAATDIPIGVVTETKSTGDELAYYVINSSSKIKVKASNAAINDSAAVGTNGTGRLVAKTTSGDHAVGFAVGDIKAGEIGEVIVAPHEVA